MFFLHVSNRTENLLLQLKEVLRLVNDRDPFVPEYFVIQSQGMERMLSQKLSEYFVSWCNYEYMLPTRFFAGLGSRLGLLAGEEDYDREQIGWRLEALLRTVEGEDFSPLTHYLAGEGSAVKRYQLAGQLAYVFDQYQIMRLALLDSWQQGQLTGTGSKDVELYQMRLWNLLQADIGHEKHRGFFLRELIQTLGDLNGPDPTLPQRLSVFGLHSMPPIFLECLKALAVHCDVHFYLLTPCKHYWADQLDDRLAFRDSDDVGHGHPLLHSLGQQGREFQAMLQEVDVYAEYKSFEDPRQDGEPSLLHTLQAGLLYGDGRIDSADSVREDRSIDIVSAHSRRRELMILRDRILHWLENDPTLQLKDIVVMAPDIQEYSPLIPALFHDIPHSIADRNSAYHNRSLTVFLQLLRLCAGRFGWVEVLELLEREEIYPRFELTEKELPQIRHWVYSSGIRWGLSVDHRQRQGAHGGRECTWEAGLERLLMGYAVDSMQSVAGIYPYREIEGGMAEPLGGLAAFCRILDNASLDFAKERPLAAWSLLLREYVDRLFVSDGEKGDALVELYAILNDVGQLYGTLHTDPVNFSVITSWIEAAATVKKSSAGFLRGQLTFCSMLPMRSIPFKKVCLLGLNDTEFPKNDVSLPFDLLSENFVAGDRSRRSDDRYQFLEAILSARETLYLSYVGQSLYSNDTIAPSVVLAELIELIELYDSEFEVERHLLHGFSQDYFSTETALYSYDKQLCEVAKSMGEGEREAKGWWHGSVNDTDDGQVALEALFAFFSHPQRYFFRKVTGIRLAQEVEPYQEHEPFVLDPLQNYLVEQQLVIEENVSGQLKRLQAAGAWPLGSPGSQRFSQKEEEMLPFKKCLNGYGDFADGEELVVDLVVNATTISGLLTTQTDSARLLYRYARCKGKDVLQAWLHHCICQCVCTLRQKTILLTKELAVTFPESSGGMADLEMLLSHYLDGVQAPSSLYLDPLLEYARQRQKTEKSGRGNPMAAALRSYQQSAQRGYEPEWEMLHRNLGWEDILGADFEALCDWFYSSVWKKVVTSELVWV